MISESIFFSSMRVVHATATKTSGCSYGVYKNTMERRNSAFEQQCHSKVIVAYWFSLNAVWLFNARDRSDVNSMNICHQQLHSVEYITLFIIQTTLLNSFQGLCLFDDIRFLISDIYLNPWRCAAVLVKKVILTPPLRSSSHRSNH